MTAAEQVILVNEQDEAIGLMEKMEAHRKALLHRAFSVLVFNSRGELLLQQRAAVKYHSAGLWTNTCCSHPRPGESGEAAAHRRLQEEMGFDCPLEYRFHFIYKTELEHGLSEHELDYVYYGYFDGEPVINRDEVAAWRWLGLDALKAEVQQEPQKFTFWLRDILNRI